MTASHDPLSAWRFDTIKTVPDIARHWAAATPGKIALIDGPATQTYAELARLATRVGHRLISLGIPPASNIGFIGKNALEFYGLWMGAGNAACALAPFNWRCTADELVDIVGDAAPPIVIVSEECEEVMRAVLARVATPFEIVVFTPASRGGQGLEPWLEDVPEQGALRTPLASDVALLSYTSGTTGVPKGAMATHDAFYHSFLCGVLEPAMTFQEGDVMLMSMPNFHLGGSWVSLAALYHGQTLSILPAFDPAACIAAMTRDRITIAPIVPAAIQMLLDQPGVGPDSFGALRSVIYFGSPISPALMARALEQMGCDLSQYYGTTEMWFLTILRHEHHLDDGSARLNSCGVPMPLVSLKILDEAGAEVAPGEIGEVVVRTPMRFAGYWRRPEATAEVMKDGWYHTGDLGRVDEGGYLYVVDRAKDMIISGGENIYSTEVEKALQKLPGVRACAAVGLPDDKWGERVTAALIVDPAVGLTEEGVIAHCRSLIAAYKAPKQVLFVDSLPMTPTGKVKKAALREQLRAAMAVTDA